MSKRTPAPADGSPRAEILEFAKAMEAKLRRHDHKPGWIHMPDDLILKLAFGEMYELDIAINHETPEEVMKEAADVANFAMFLWDKARRRLAELRAKT